MSRPRISFRSTYNGGRNNNGWAESIMSDAQDVTSWLLDRLEEIHSKACKIIKE
jgi:hypothetical protein